MEDKQQRIRQLFVKLADGTSTPDERKELLDYLEGSPLPEALPLADELPLTGNWPRMPEDAGEQIRMRILSEASPAAPARVRRIGWWKAAAVLLPVVGLSTWLLWDRSADSQLYVNNARSVQVIRLEDGSEVSLNRNARLTFRGGANREAWLEGEAFFTIAGHASKPFIVHTRQQLDITVLGTSFNVKSGEQATEVVLNTGKVKVGDGGKAVILQPGEMAVYDAKAHQVSTQQADTLMHTSWKNELLPFRERPLKEVMGFLQAQFGYAVTFDGPETENLVFTGYLSTSDLQQSILTLEQTFSIKISIGNRRLHVNKQ
ncbi:FecR family protein [Chitinophaga caseinilytica]|uniref:FecR domain-containing protein n=1 Tax=Chitinophaga caseinilytica TaxID=2267521 RepID=A0ABZ2Z5V7_9BACT